MATNKPSQIRLGFESQNEPFQNNILMFGWEHKFQIDLNIKTNITSFGIQ